MVSLFDAASIAQYINLLNSGHTGSIGIGCLVNCVKKNSAKVPGLIEDVRCFTLSIQTVSSAAPLKLPQPRGLGKGYEMIHQQGCQGTWFLTCDFKLVRHLSGQLLHSDVCHGSQDHHWALEIG